MKNLPVKLLLVIPCYNEGSILRGTAARLNEKLDALSAAGLVTPDSAILFVDDGSADATWEIISALHAETPARFLGLSLAGNRGHQNALFAGLMYAKDHADAALSLDADLQDDPGVTEKFLEEYGRGSEIVYGVRTRRACDSFFKRASAGSYYRLLRFLGIRTVFNHADFRLMSRRALELLSQYKEVHLYLRGLIPLIGLRQSLVMYERKPSPRPTRYPLRKMMHLAWDGITSFSVRPLRLISLTGFCAALAGIVLLLYLLGVTLAGGTAGGWAFTAALLLFLSGGQLLATGVLGEYVFKNYMESKARPRYQIRETLDTSATRQ